MSSQPIPKNQYDLILIGSYDVRLITLNTRRTPPPAPPRTRGGEPKPQARVGLSSLIMGNLPDMILPGGILNPEVGAAAAKAKKSAGIQSAKEQQLTNVNS